MSLTPFAHIYTHSLKRDAIEQGLSHFYYEHAYYEKMLDQESTHNTLVLLDEPYSCTNAQTGTEHIGSLINRIEQSPHKLAIIATHYAVN